MRTRLRERHEDEQGFYTGRYPSGYRHDRWPDHVERVAASLDFLARHLPSGVRRSAADLSCGDGAILNGIQATRKIYGDINPNSALSEFTDADHLVLGPLPDTLEYLDGAVSLLVCSEILEHLDDPDAFLRRARNKAFRIFVSTPVGERPSSDPRGGNHEHYWGWDTEAVDVMLRTAGWHPLAHEVFEPESADVYTFQFWLCI